MRGGLIGSPETIRNKLKKFETSKVDSIILLNQAGKNTHEHICESLELFAKEVMPEFHALEPEHQAWKKKVLNREIELEEIDVTPFKERTGVGKGVAIDKLVAKRLICRLAPRSKPCYHLAAAPGSRDFLWVSPRSN